MIFEDSQFTDAIKPNAPPMQTKDGTFKFPQGFHQTMSIFLFLSIN